MGRVVLEAGGIATATDRVRFSACPQKNKNMTKYTHGIATAVKEITTSEGKIEVNSQGTVTAYLPDYDKFAVDFGNGQWIAFDRVSFDKYCKIN
jgi:hypothetical protein